MQWFLMKWLMIAKGYLIVVYELMNKNCPLWSNIISLKN